MQKESKICQNCKNQFTIEPADFEFYEKIKVPAPTWCVECRALRRIINRNERTLYKRKCDLCNKEIISRFSPDKPYPVYCRECWWSDKWDPADYGRDYDPTKTFFEQFRELLYSIPHVALIGANNINSEWVNQETESRNCYLNIGGHANEDSAYNIFELYGKNCFDNYWLFNSELCYENINSYKCYKTLFSTECFDCQEVILSYDCRGCSNIFGCAGLRNKQYYVFNKPYSRENYFVFLKNNPISSYTNLQKLKKQSEILWLSIPHKFAAILKSNKVTGYLINESKNSYNIWNAEKTEDSKNGYIIADLKDCEDITTLGWSELCYECSSSMGLYNSKMTTYIIGGMGARSTNLEYCYGALDSHNCFGCVNSKKMEYSILNKRYLPGEYQKLRKQIIRDMNDKPYTDPQDRVYKYGEFFPPFCSLFGYNETTAQDHYPLTCEEALQRGFYWCNYETTSQYPISDYQIPDNIKNVGDDILQQVLKCEVSSKPYRIIPMELEFYHKIGLPIPLRHPEQRNKDRINKLLPKKLFLRKCQCVGTGLENKVYQNAIEHFHKNTLCPNEIQTPYAPERPEIVYCEQCYQSEIV